MSFWRLSHWLTPFRLCDQRLLRSFRFRSIRNGGYLRSPYLLPAHRCHQIFRTARLQLHKPSASHINFARVGSCEIKDFYVAMVRTTQKPNSSFVFCFAHLCPRSFLWARRAKFTRLGYGFRIMPPAHRGCHSSCQIKDLKRRHRSAPALCSTQIAWEPRLSLSSHTSALILLAKRSRAKARFIRA